MGVDDIIKMIDQSQKFANIQGKIEKLLKKFLDENKHVVIISLGTDDGLPLAYVTKKEFMTNKEFNLSAYLSIILNTSNRMLNNLASDQLAYSFIKGQKYNVLMYYVGGEYLLGVAYEGSIPSQEFTEWAKKVIKELKKVLYG